MSYLTTEEKKLILKLSAEAQSSRYIAQILENDKETIIRNSNRVGEGKNLLPLPTRSETTHRRRKLMTVDYCGFTKKTKKLLKSSEMNGISKHVLRQLEEESKEQGLRGLLNH